MTTIIVPGTTDNASFTWPGDTDWDSTEDDSPIARPLRVTVAIIVSIMIITSNILNLATLRITRQIPLISRQCLLNLSAADLLVGVISCLPCVIPAFTGRWPYGDIWCQIAGITHGMSVTMSIWSLALVSIDRYIAIIFPLSYASKVTITRVRILLLILWMLSFLTFFMPLWTKSDFIYYQFTSAELMCGLYWEYPWFCVITAVYIPILSGSILLFTTVKVSREVVKMAAASSAATSTNMAGNNPVKKDELKPVRVLIVTSLVYFLAWGPYVMEVVVLSAKPSLNIPAYLRFTTIWLANSNSFMNVFIYSVMYSSFRRNLLRLLSNCLRLKRHVQIAPGSSVLSQSAFPEASC